VSAIGRAVPRVDGVRKVTGGGRYACDLRFPRLLEGLVVRSTRPHARIRAIDTAAARAVPGVRAVVTAADVPNGLWGSAMKDQPSMATDVVRYLGEPVAAVAAEDEAACLEAASRLEIVYEDLPAVFDAEEAMRPGAPLVHPDAARYACRTTVCHPEPEANVLNHVRIRRGDAEALLAGAAPGALVKGRYRTQAQQHAPMETHGSVAVPEPGGRITVYTSTQAPFLVRADLAAALGRPESLIRVVPTDCGGGFGGKMHLRAEPFAAWLAEAAGRPVRVVFARSEEFSATTTRHAAVIDIATAVDGSGRLLAARVRTVLDTGAYSDSGEMVAWQTALGAVGPYRVPHLAVDSYAVYTNHVPAGSFRGMGWPQAIFAWESHLDEVARAVGRDPLAYRLEHALRDGDPSPTGEIIQQAPVAEALRQAAERIGWGRPRPRWRGVGLSTVMKTSTAPSTAGAVLKLNEDGGADLLVGAAEIGTGVHTVMAQLAAEALGLPMEQVRVAPVDTATCPYDAGARSDRTTFHLGQAVLAAAEDVREQVRDLAARLLEARAEDVEVAGGRAAVRGTARGLSLAEVAAASSQLSGPIIGRGRHQQEGIVPLDPETGQSPHAVSHFKFGAQAVEVEVEPETGAVRVLRLVSVHDCGRVLNPMLMEGQVAGAAAMGLGFALLEELRFDGGQVTNPTLMDYALPTSADVPEIEVVPLEVAHPEGPFGAKGVGEPGIIGVAPAVANAVRAACGARLTRLPITWERVLDAVEQGAAGRRPG
jgi:CO/xanthine dehydrogenase Mo-binding subunit